MHKFLKATMIVTIFAVATRALGFCLRIFLSRKMGAETLGSYQIAMSVFGVLMTIIASGIPLIVSRNVAYFEGKDKASQNRNITAGLIVAGTISIVICGVFFALGGLFQKVLSADSVNMIYILLPTLVVSSVYAILRGGMWGRKYFFTISFTEFFEQVVRIILVAILFALPMGLSNGQKSALSLTLSAVASSLLVVVLYFVYGGKLLPAKTEIKNIIVASTPITMVRTVSSVIGSIIAIILPARLMMYGYSNGEALAIFGMYMGMILPLIMVPSTFISSIAVALVPELSGFTNNISKATENSKLQLKNRINKALSLTIAISFVLMPAFWAVGEPICKVLFDNAEAGKYLVISAILMLPMGVNQICSSMLNAIGLEKRELLHYVVGAMSLVVCVILLPKYIGGYAIFAGLLSMNMISSVLSIITLKQKDLINFSFLKTIAFCLIIVLFASLIAKFTFGICDRFCGLFLSTAISGFICEVVTVLLMFVFDLFSIKVLLIKYKKKNKKVQQKTIA